MQKAVQYIRESPILVPLTLLVLSVLAYGLLIPSLGYYWDDWPYAWINHMYGPAGYPDYVALDRPYSAWIFMVLAAVWGEQPVGYHVSALLLYWGCALLFWRLIRLVWPTHEREAFWAALFFVIYPGFLGHPQAIIYNHHFSAMALYLFSLIGMIKALGALNQRDSKREMFAWHFMALIALLVSQFTIEYFLGWEVARLILAWMVVKKGVQSKAEAIRKTLLHLAPYGLVSLGFIAWRALIFKFPTYQPVEILGGQLTFQQMFGAILSQIADAVVISWRYALPHFNREKFSQAFWLIYLGLSALTTLVIYSLLHIQNQEKSSNPQASAKIRDPFGIQALKLAVFSILFAGIPFWITGLSLRIDNRFYSRFTLAFIPWIALLIAALFYFVSKIRVRWIKKFVAGMMALLIGGSVGWHFWNANVYRNDWIEVQRYFQQLATRMPAIEPGTALVINDMDSLSLYQDDSLSAILNWTYAPENTSGEMPYLMQYLSVRLGREIPALQPGLPIEQSIRSQHFSGSTDRMIVVFYQPTGCLRVLDDQDPYRLPIGFPEELREALHLSNLSLIQEDEQSQTVLPLHLFDIEEEDTWCTYFEGADLAAQQKDWLKVTEMGDKAFGKSMWANELTEIYVFIEGYLRAGRTEKALEVSEALSETSAGRMDHDICNLWRQVEVDVSGGFVLPDFCEP